MRTNRPLLIILAVVSAALMVLLSFLLNLASTYLADALQSYALWIFIALGITFVLSVAVLIWQLRVEPQFRREAPPSSGLSIDQEVAGGGQIKRSPNRIVGQSQGLIRQTASDGGRIDESGNTIE